MSHVFRIPDETYRTLCLVAEQQGQTVEDLFNEWVREQWGQVSTAHGTDPGATRLTRFIGAFESEEPDLILHHDHYLAEAAAESRDLDR